MGRRIRRESEVKGSLRTWILIVFAVTWFIVVVILAGVAVHTQVRAAQINGVQSSLSRIALSNNTVEQTTRSVDLIGIRLVNSGKVRALTGPGFVGESEEEQRKRVLMVRSLLYEDDYVLRPGHRVTLMLSCGDGRVYANLDNVFSEKTDGETLSLLRALSGLPEADAPYVLDIAPSSSLLPDQNTLVYRRRFSSPSTPGYESVLYIFVKNSEYLNELRYDGNSMRNYAAADADGRVLVSDRREWIGQRLDGLFGATAASLEGQNHYLTLAGGHLLVFDKNAGSRFTGVQLLSRSEFIESARQIVVLVIALAVVFIFIFFALSFYLSRRLTDPLRKLGQKMYQTAGGDMSARFEPRFNDEIGLIGHQFDSMVDRLGKSMERLRETEHEKRRAELRALEMQINPHFMYNTLSSIVWLASEEKNDDVIDITKMLSCYLRQSLSEGREFITVKEEIEHVRTYLTIQNYRYANLLECRFEIDPATEAIPMPKLMLQPLVENAIYHGIKERREGDGQILVRTLKEDGALKLEVWDNGDIDADRCAEMNAAMQAGESLGIGTDTVNSRLRLYYGEAYALGFAKRGAWTVAAIRIPEAGGRNIDEAVDRG